MLWHLFDQVERANDLVSLSQVKAAVTVEHPFKLLNFLECLEGLVVIVVFTGKLSLKIFFI